MSTAIKITNLSVLYGSLDAISNINLEIKRGEFVCIIGPNGGGKTTLISSILGFLKSSKGSIEIFGSKVPKSKTKIGYVPQGSQIENGFPITVEDAVMTGFLDKSLNPFRTFKKTDRDKANKILSSVGLEGYGKRQISQLSGGELQRLLIARALSLNPEILLLDEPTSNVDAVSRNLIFDLLRELNGKGITIVAVTHDIDAVREYSNRVICINKEMVFCGLSDSIENNLQKLYY